MDPDTVSSRSGAAGQNLRLPRSSHILSGAIALLGCGSYAAGAGSRRGLDGRSRCSPRRLLLAAAELLYKPHVKPSDDLDVMANLVAEFLPTYEIGSITDPIMLFLRSYIFLTIIIPQLPAHLKTFEVEALFEQQFGFPLRRYYQFIFSFIIHAMTERNEKPAGTPIDGALRTSWFQKTTIPQDQVSKMFDTVCFSLDDLPDPRVTLGYGDFEFLRDHPYFRHDGAMYCLDYVRSGKAREWGAVEGAERAGFREACVLPRLLGERFRKLCGVAFQYVRVQESE